MSDNNVKEGDQVSWQWSGSRPGGKVTEVKEHGEVSMTSHRGNEVKKNADGPENPAVKIERSGNDVVKKASEVDVEKSGDKHKEAPGEEKEVGKDKPQKEDDKKEQNGDDAKKEEEEKDDDDKDDKDDDGKKQNGEHEKTDEKKNSDEASTGDKRKADSASDQKKGKGDSADAAKKQKTRHEEPKENGEAPKKKGRPAKNESTPKKDSKKKEPKKAATESGEPRRSGRVASKSS